MKKGKESGPSLPWAVLAAVFCASGASGLIYEVAWTRMLRLVVGSTVLSHTIVLTAFMGGLALGAWFAGRRVDAATRPLRIYAFLELAIGAYGLLLPPLVKAAFPLVAALYRSCEGSPGVFALGELLILSPIILPASALMGATLPALGRAVARSNVAREGGRLYAANTFGAAFGAWLAGFMILPSLGLFLTTVTAALTNAALAAIVLWLDRSSVPETPIPAPLESAAPAAEPELGSPRLAALVVLLTGLAGMTLQIVWTKLFVVSVGSSTFAFSGVVAIYILGLGSGAALGTWSLGLRVAPSRLLAIAAGGSAFLAIFTPPFFAWLPSYAAGLVSEHHDELAAGVLGPLMRRELALLLLALGPATLCLGATFPLAVAVAGGSPSKPGRALARVSSASSVGSIGGALVGGLVLLPLLGLTGALRAGALLLGVAGLLALLAAKRKEPRWVLLSTSGAILAVVLLGLTLPAPGPEVVDSGAFLSMWKVVPDVHKQNRTLMSTLKRRDRIVKHIEGDDVVAALYSSGSDEYLVVNGKTDASSRLDAETQLLLGYIPMIVRGPGAKKVLVIGLGSGMTTGACLSYPGVEHLDLVEISRTVVEAVKASYVFEKIANAPLKDPRTRLLIADGRTHVWSSNETYDVIVSEPTNPWIAGVGDLFTKEHFEHLKERLAPGGVLCQWLQGYSTNEKLFATNVRTFRSVFPGTQLWRCALGEDFLLITRKDGEEPQIKLEDVRAAMNGSPRLKEMLEEAGIFEPEGLYWYFTLDKDGIAELGGGDSPINTDDSGFLEFNAPYGLFFDSHILDNPAMEKRAQEARFPFVDARPDDVTRVRKARPDYYEAVRVAQGGGEMSNAIAAQLLARIMKQRPPSPWVVRLKRAELLSQGLGRPDLKVTEREDMLAEVADLKIYSPLVLWDFAKAAWSLGDKERGDRDARRVLELRPRWDAARLTFADVLLKRKDFAGVMDLLAPMSDDDPKVLATRGAALMGLGRLDEARSALGRAVVLDPRSFIAWISLGIIRSRAQDTAGARDAFEKAVSAQPENAEGWIYLAAASLKLNDMDRAKEACEKALAISPGEARAQAILGQVRKPG